MFQEEEKEQEEAEAANNAHFNDEHFEDVSQDEEKANGEDGDSDSDDSDDIKVTIGEIKSGPAAYGSLNIKVCTYFHLNYQSVYQLTI